MGPAAPIFGVLAALLPVCVSRFEAPFGHDRCYCFSAVGMHWVDHGAGALLEWNVVDVLVNKKSHPKVYLYLTLLFLSPELKSRPVLELAAVLPFRVSIRSNLRTKRSIDAETVFSSLSTTSASVSLFCCSRAHRMAISLSLVLSTALSISYSLP
jgi:hypothetical protein